MVTVHGLGTASPHLFQARATLASGTPVTVADQTAKTTIYLTPHGGNLIGLFNGSAWVPRELSEISIAVPSTTNTNYDIYVNDSSGTPTLELTAWSSDTARATTLTRQDGVYVKSGDATRRYVGTMRTAGTIGQTVDTITQRFLWNYYNRVPRLMVKQELTSSWTYGTNAWRYWNNSSTNRIEMVVGVDEDIVDTVLIYNFNHAASNGTGASAIGLDSSTAVSSDCFYQECQIPPASKFEGQTSTYRAHVGIGYHFMAMIENNFQTSANMINYGSLSNSRRTGLRATIRG